MARKGLSPIAAGRGKVVKLPPRVPDPIQWLNAEFDWDTDVSVVDMFCGAGGMSFGLDSVAGMGIVAAFEIDLAACETHAANLSAPVFRGDVAPIQCFATVLRQSGVRRVDVLVGGPPCQGFSRLGKGALRKLALDEAALGADEIQQLELEDERNFMFRHFMRAVRQIEPQVVMIENVPEMLNCTSVIEEIKEIFESLDYRFEYRVLKASEHGVPQRRRRLFMIANRSGVDVDWPAGGAELYSLRDAIGDLPSIGAGHMIEEVGWEAPDNLGPYLAEMRSDLEGEEIRLIRDHVTRVHRPEDVEAFSLMQEGDKYGVVPDRLRRYRADIFQDKYHRMVWNEPSWTVTAHLAKDGYKYIHPGQNRTISVREAARLQSFPDRFRFAGGRTSRFAQIGNAVPPKLAAALGPTLHALVE